MQAHLDNICHEFEDGRMKIVCMCNQTQEQNDKQYQKFRRNNRNINPTEQRQVRRV